MFKTILLGAALVGGGMMISNASTNGVGVPRAEKADQALQRPDIREGSSSRYRTGGVYFFPYSTYGRRYGGFSGGGFAGGK